MGIPRFRNKIFCYTIEQISLRTGFSNLFTFAILAVVFLYLSSQTENTEESASQTIFIVLGVIFLIPALFSLLLIIGILRKNLKLLFVWLIYSAICNTCLAFLLLGGSIYYIVSVDAGTGVGYLFLMLILSASLWYGTLVVRSLYLDYKEAEAAKSLEMGQQNH